MIQMATRARAKRRKKCETFTIAQPTKSTTSKSKSVSWTIQITENLLECPSIFCTNRSSRGNPPPLCPKAAQITDFITTRRVVWILDSRFRSSPGKDCSTRGKSGNIARATTWSKIWSSNHSHKKRMERLKRGCRNSSCKRAMPGKYSSLSTLMRLESSLSTRSGFWSSTRKK